MKKTMRTFLTQLAGITLIMLLCPLAAFGQSYSSCHDEDAWAVMASDAIDELDSALIEVQSYDRDSLAWPLDGYDLILAAILDNARDLHDGGCYLRALSEASNGLDWFDNFYALMNK